MSLSREKKELALGYALWCLGLVGICGVQRLYIGQVGYGLVLLFTFGLCGLAQLLDLLLLPSAVANINQNNRTIKSPSNRSLDPQSDEIEHSSIREIEKLIEEAKTSLDRSTNSTDQQ